MTDKPTKADLWRATQAKMLSGMKGARAQSIKSRASSSTYARKVQVTLPTFKCLEDTPEQE